MLVNQYNYFMIHRDIEDAIDPWLGRDKIIILRGRQAGWQDDHSEASRPGSRSAVNRCAT